MMEITNTPITTSTPKYFNNMLYFLLTNIRCLTYFYKTKLPQEQTHKKKNEPIFT